MLHIQLPKFPYLWADFRKSFASIFSLSDLIGLIWMVLYYFEGQSNHGTLVKPQSILLEPSTIFTKYLHHSKPSSWNVMARQEI